MSSLLTDVNRVPILCAMRKEDQGRPYFDDMGNFVGYGGKSVVVSKDGEHVDGVYKTLDESRLLTRNAGCFNCLHYNTGVEARERLNACFRRDVLVYMGKGLERGMAERKAKGVIDEISQKVATGHIGACLINASIDPRQNKPADFTAATHLCGDPVTGQLVKWVARTGVSLARDPGEGLSPSIAEEYDKRGDKAPIVKALEQAAEAAAMETKDEA